MSESNCLAVVPNGVNRAICSDDSNKADQRSVVVARQSGMRADAYWLRESLPAIRRSCEQNDGFIELPLNPADIEISGIRAVGLVVGENARHIFPLNIGFIPLPSFHGGRVGIPGLPSVR